MQIAFEALEKALAPIEKIGQGEKTFPVGSCPVTVRVLTPEEEVEVQQYSNEALGSGESMSSTAAYLERFKVAVLSHAICQVGDQDLRDVDFVETGEKLENGQAIKVTKLMAIRKLILRWTGSIRIALFKKYGELLIEVESRAEKAVSFEPSDLEAEIERLEKRMEELKAEKERRSNPDKAVETKVSRLAKALIGEENDEDAAKKPEVQAGVEELVEPVVVTPPPPAPQPTVRKSIIPQMAPPPGEAKMQSQMPPAPPVVQDQQEAAPVPPPPPPPVEMDSFVDPSDTDNMQAAIAAENQRLMARRRGVPTPDPSVMSALRRPPHLDAKEAADAMAELEAMGPESLGAGPDGVETFRMPTEVVNGVRPDPKARTPLNRVQGQESRNPRFRPAPKG